jgi:hypothetical protein
MGAVAYLRATESYSEFYTEGQRRGTPSAAVGIRWATVPYPDPCGLSSAGSKGGSCSRRQSARFTPICRAATGKPRRRDATLVLGSNSVRPPLRPCRWSLPGGRSGAPTARVAVTVAVANGNEPGRSATHHSQVMIAERGRTPSISGPLSMVSSSSRFRGVHPPCGFDSLLRHQPSLTLGPHDPRLSFGWRTS